MQANNFIQQILNKETSLAFTHNWQQELTDYIQQLIDTNFEKLVFLLYRIDVSEQKIKILLQNNHQLSAEIISKAIIDRLIEKQQSRELYKQNNNIDEEDKW
jgi:hypothetical protein